MFIKNILNILFTTFDYSKKLQNKNRTLVRMGHNDLIFFKRIAIQ